MSDDATGKRFRATIAYDGTAFHGSQLQPDVRTVQGEAEAALSRLFDDDARIDLAGRTDTGVHAVAQEIAFDAPAQWEPTELARALSAILPEDLRLRTLDEAQAGFHPRFDATGRRYQYIVTGREGSGPFQRNFCWALDRPLAEIDTGVLVSLAPRIEGERSFEAFAKSGQPERGTNCRVETAEWTRGPGPFLVFCIVADRFLHHMVRYLVGTSVEIATGRRPLDDFDTLLAGGEASRAVFPSPPTGLYLSGIRYEETWNRTAGPLTELWTWA